MKKLLLVAGVVTYGTVFSTMDPIEERKILQEAAKYAKAKLSKAKLSKEKIYELALDKARFIIDTSYPSVSSDFKDILESKKMSDLDKIVEIYKQAFKKFPTLFNNLKTSKITSRYLPLVVKYLLDSKHKGNKEFTHSMLRNILDLPDVSEKRLKEVANKVANSSIQVAAGDANWAILKDLEHDLGKNGVRPNIETTSLGDLKTSSLDSTQKTFLEYLFNSDTPRAIREKYASYGLEILNNLRSKASIKNTDLLPYMQKLLNLIKKAPK